MRSRRRFGSRGLACLALGIWLVSSGICPGWWLIALCIRAVYAGWNSGHRCQRAKTRPRPLVKRIRASEQCKRIQVGYLGRRQLNTCYGRAGSTYLLDDNSRARTACLTEMASQGRPSFFSLSASSPTPPPTAIRDSPSNRQRSSRRPPLRPTQAPIAAATSRGWLGGLYDLDALARWRAQDAMRRVAGISNEPVDTLDAIISIDGRELST